MALIFGSGEPIDRLRRAFDVKGKVNLAVDETIVPIILLQDASRPPFRKTGLRWWAPQVVASVVGELARYRVFHTFDSDQLIDQIILCNLMGFRNDFTIGHGPFGVAVASRARTTENVNIGNLGGIISKPTFIQSFADSVTPASIGSPLLEVSVPPNDSLIVPVEIVLPAAGPGAAFGAASTLTIESAAAAVNVNITCSGLLFDSLPLNVRT